MKFTIIFIAIFLLGFVLYGFLHEQVHVSIFKSHGLSDVKVNYIKDFPDFTTTAVGNCDGYCKLANNMTEAISYSLTPFYFMMGFAFLLIICILENNVQPK